MHQPFSHQLTFSPNNFPRLHLNPTHHQIKDFKGFNFLLETFNFSFFFLFIYLDIKSNQRNQKPMSKKSQKQRKTHPISSNSPLFLPNFPLVLAQSHRNPLPKPPCLLVECLSLFCFSSFWLM